MKRYYLIIPLVASAILLVIPYAIYSGNYIMYVHSDSMYPTLKPNDLLVVKKTSIDEVKVGDIIAFDSHAEGIGIIAHRAVEIFETGGKIGIDTKGDHLDEPDLWTVLDDDLVGIVTEINPDTVILLAEPVRYFLVAVIVVTGVLLARESIPKKSIEVRELSCERCHYRWHPRIIDGKVKIPDTCPNKDCRSPYWRTKKSSH